MKRPMKNSSDPSAKKKASKTIVSTSTRWLKRTVNLPGYLLAESAEREREEEAKAIKAIKRAVQEGPKDEDDTAVEDFTSGGVFASADDYADMINDDDANAVDPSKLDDEDADADEDEGDIDVNDDDESDDDDDENDDDDDDDESDEEPSPPPKTRSSSSKKTKTLKSSSKSPRVPVEDAPQLRVTRSSNARVASHRSLAIDTVKRASFIHSFIHSRIPPRARPKRLAAPNSLCTPFWLTFDRSRLDIQWVKRKTSPPRLTGRALEIASDFNLVRTRRRDLDRPLRPDARAR